MSEIKELEQLKANLKIGLKQKIKTSVGLLIASALLVSTATQAQTPKSKIISAEEVKWGYLNPLRGKLSPRAANLWGDRTKDTATGMLVGFNKGFRSPEHIHNITYRGVVIEGMVHNDDPEAADMWLPTGSYWTQPAGEIHITAANGETNLIYLEIESGPYLVKPSAENFDNGERPINQHRNNIVWLRGNELSNTSIDSVEQAVVWRSAKGQSGTLVKLPKGFKGNIKSEAQEFRAVVISGEVNYASAETTTTNLAPASYIESSGQFIHQFTNTSNKPVTIYVRSDQGFVIE